MLRSVLATGHRAEGDKKKLESFLFVLLVHKTVQNWCPLLVPLTVVTAHPCQKLQRALGAFFHGSE